ncbi:MAG: hypothetical protein ACLR8Y_16595 [Alistipes indistinctus]
MSRGAEVRRPGALRIDIADAQRNQLLEKLMKLIIAMTTIRMAMVSSE